MADWKISQKEFNHQFGKAVVAGKQAMENEPVAVSARFDKKSNRVIVDLKSGISFMFPVLLTQGLSDAHPSDLKEIIISPSGQGLYWPTLDVDLSIPHILQGFLGTKSWMSSIFSDMGKKGGSQKSMVKTRSARQNGKLGGRPRKKAV